MSSLTCFKKECDVHTNRRSNIVNDTFDMATCRCTKNPRGTCGSAYAIFESEDFIYQAERSDEAIFVAFPISRTELVHLRLSQKWFELILVLFLGGTVSVSLCTCTFMQDMRACQAFRSSLCITESLSLVCSLLLHLLSTHIVQHYYTQLFSHWNSCFSSMWDILNSASYVKLYQKADDICIVKMMMPG